MINTIQPWKEQTLVYHASVVQSTFTYFTGRRCGALQLANNEHVHFSHFSPALCSSSWFPRLCVDKSTTVAWWKLGWWGIYVCNDKSMLESDEAQVIPVPTTFNWAMKLVSTNEFGLLDLMKYQINACSSLLRKPFPRLAPRNSGKTQQVLGKSDGGGRWFANAATECYSGGCKVRVTSGI